MISAPVAVEPVKATLSTPGMPDEVRARRRAVGPGTMLIDAGREADLARELRQAQRA